MDCSMCSICRTLPRISLVFAVVAASLVLQPMSVSSRNLEEQPCKLRPTVVPVEKAGFKPYHIELHRCSGTCGNSPPTHRPCKATSEKTISLDLTDLATGKPSTVSVKNHTKCGCDCEVNCKVGEYPDDKKCICVSLQTGKRVGEDKKESMVNVFPYQIGMAIVGFFALCVLVFDMILCGRDKGVLYKVKEKCCKSDQVDNKEGMATLQNGQCTSARKDNSSSEAV